MQQAGREPHQTRAGRASRTSRPADRRRSLARLPAGAPAAGRHPTNRRCPRSPTRRRRPARRGPARGSTRSRQRSGCPPLCRRPRIGRLMTHKTSRGRNDMLPSPPNMAARSRPSTSRGCGWADRGAPQNRGCAIAPFSWREDGNVSALSGPRRRTELGSVTPSSNAVPPTANAWAPARTTPLAGRRGRNQARRPSHAPSLPAGRSASASSEMVVSSTPWSPRRDGLRTLAGRRWRARAGRTEWPSGRPRRYRLGWSPLFRRGACPGSQYQAPGRPPCRSLR